MRTTAEYNAMTFDEVIADIEESLEDGTGLGIALTCKMARTLLEGIKASRPEAQAQEAALLAIDAEEEAPGPMPEEMWKAINGDRDAIEEAIRIAIRLTKKGIRERLLGHAMNSGLDK